MFPATGDERFDKLPRWARDKFSVLETRNADLERLIAQYEVKPTESTPIRIVGYARPDTALPDNSTIRFRIGENHEEYIEVGFEYDDTRRGKGKIAGLFVRSGGRIYIEPQAANSFFAKCEMRRDRAAATQDGAQ